MTVERIGVDPREPAVQSEALRPFVDAARSQPTLRLKIDAASVRAAWAQRRASRRRGLVIAVAAGLGALAFASWYGQRPPASSGRDAPGLVAQVQDATPEPSSRVAAPAAPDPSDPSRVPAVEPAAPVLADAVAITAVHDVPPEYDIDGPFAVSLRRGAARLHVAEGAAQPLAVALPDARLEVVTGVTIVELAGSMSTVVVQSGVAFRIERDGTRTELRPAPEAQPEPAAPTPGAAELAELAEQQLAAGDRKGAIKHLRQLVKSHPRSAAARTGLLDLGRLLKTSGQDAAARCAYQEFLSRYPDSSLVDEVERALDELPADGECRGLTPTR